MPRNRARTRPSRAVALLTTALLALTLPVVGPAVATAAPTPGLVVTVAGTLQDELGCPADWQPACPATVLPWDPATQTYRAAFDVPAGSYQYKITIGGGWAENYGANGVKDGPEIPLVLQGGARITFSYDSESHVTTAVSVPAALTRSQERALAGTSLREDLTREQFYFVMADRFANADPSNDLGGLTGDRLTTGFDPTAKGFYHGGDLKGIASKLDYLQGMGVTAIWMTPSFKNKPVQGTGDNVSAGYHGYWITDFTQIDPHLGTNAELTDLIGQAHKRGMKVFFDIITNHTADVIDYRQGLYSYIDKKTAPYKDAAGTAFDDRDYVSRPAADFPKLDPAVSFPYTPFYPTTADQTVKVPAALNDLTWYHNRGDSTFAGESNVYGDFVGLDDLFTEQPVVRDQMIDIYKAWASFGVDGFRIDTVKHVNMEFWQKFSPEILKAATSDRLRSNDDFFMFGEVYDSNPAFTSQYTTTGRLQATLDFGFQSAATNFGLGKPTTGLRDLFAGDDYYTDTDSNVYQSPTFLGNHDMGRIGYFLSKDSSASEDELLQRDELAHALMYTSRGQPVVYYGDEQGFTGSGGDQDARQDMFPSQVASYQDDNQLGSTATPAADNFDPNHPLYREIAALSKLRKQNPALADGAQIHRYASGEAGIYAFSRIDARDQVEYIVVANNATEPKSATFDTFTAGGQFRSIYPDRGGRLGADREGRVSVTVPPLSLQVFKATDRLGRSRAAATPAFLAPVAAGTGTTRAEIRVAVPGDGFNQVSFGWRAAGTTDWHALGTDDNAPYRVFQDVSGLAKGTLIEYAAVVRDNSGHTSSAVTSSIVGDPPPPPASGGGPVTQPTNVSAPGDLNSEMGCPDDWQPACDQAQLALDPKDKIWKRTSTLPAGSYSYKAAINKSWDENYGAGAVRNGGNIPVTVSGAPVTFYYDHSTHWITSTANGPIITAPGSFQSELGCPADWSPSCMRPWLQDPDGDGTFTFATKDIPAGSYEVKAAHGLSWDENYGAGGTPGGANIPFSVASGDVVTFSYAPATHVLSVVSQPAPPTGSAPDLAKAKAQWLQRGLVAWDLPAGAKNWTYRLYWADQGGLSVDAEAVLGGPSIPLTFDRAGLPASVRGDWPHLAGHDALRLSDKDARNKWLLAKILKGQVAVAAFDDTGALVDATGVQIPGVLDDLYAGARDRTLGVTFGRGGPTFALWAPTAQNVRLTIVPNGASDPVTVPMKRDDDGVWTVSGGRDWTGARYRFQVQVYAPSTGRMETNDVTDPYSVALSTNSVWSIAADLSASSLAPPGWSRLAKPALAQPENSTIYELHVRDFSIADQTVPAAERGTYLGFTHPDSAGMKHLKALSAAGLNTVHLLPAFDIATIPENRADQQTPACDLAALPPDSQQQQACVMAVADQDGFNWGYDPLHYTTPEGSYATNPDGTARTMQFRQMVAGLNGIGLRVVMDVVYNHTAASGQDPKSILDRVVPGYYQRLSSTGTVETSTCCANTASEHAMMEKLMIDSLVTWAKQYKVDGFRFDLMGHHSKQNLLNIRAALDKLTPGRDGVDGKKIFLYGEGWNFGEVADNARFVQATQANMTGTGIATFSDRLRDAVRGGGPFDDDPRIQGFGTGLFTAPNDSPENGNQAEQRNRLLHYSDLIAVGLVGNLAGYRFTNSAGQLVTGADVDYNGSPAGYTADPSEVITYVDAHDNETLFDASLLKLPTGTSPADRVRYNTVSLATTALSQGPVLWHAGNDLLRSKSLDRNSYNSGDWFNRIDWTGQQSTFGSGLPPAPDNSAKWPYMQPLLADATAKPDAAAMQAATAAAQDLLKLRFSSPLFRLGDAKAIQDKVSFPNLGATPGVIVMQIDDTKGKDVDRTLRKILVVFNATPAEATVTGATGLALSPIQAQGSDPIVKQVAVNGDTVSVPPRTVAVLQG
jgi:pullulanase-type alpha-1,6-glucosidase